MLFDWIIWLLTLAFGAGCWVAGWVMHRELGRGGGPQIAQERRALPATRLHAELPARQRAAVSGRRVYEITDARSGDGRV